MSDLAATGCGGSCGSSCFGGNNSCLLLLILLCCCGGGNNDGCGCGNGCDSLIWMVTAALDVATTMAADVDAEFNDF